ncbi:TENA/THI-4 family protein [Roseobacter sp. HKCCD9010]|uniref:TenA family protein n=1 Tax=unclassified Roseobacter TaxID=196798 RepID=UPI0014928618|nr:MULTISPECIES: TenA family protein [unclassified Roseobacter]MBF9052540.1 TENA/THI-4 family protein [Rhodobacterales bacterium HKCCD4356]NNV14475.1 TENA/THI-4 family protein [Roseobacter sp. HKCCD7357]NNV18741.1 TENA/THI-4 family protein [Roseobacter sp. HKCCD8768]NNV28185.1 TENA/THI-4 family protein [Roseobacter sp. HKCCD8192]NNV32469.1 TENA/THI-4 family protein [Roseobacter sp. HKCCD9061]
MTPTEQLREENRENWDAATQHPFTTELVAGTLSLDKMAGYLQQDYHFIDTFVRLLAVAISQAPSLPDRVPGAQFLAVVTGAENTYFQRSFAALDVSDTAPVHGQTQAFLDLMHRVRKSGNYGEMIAVLTVAEWVYLSWATPFAARAEQLPFYFGEWIALHTGESFASVVIYLREQLDDVWATSPKTDRLRIASAFADAVALERAFFDAAWFGFPVAK